MKINIVATSRGVKGAEKMWWTRGSQTDTAAGTDNHLLLLELGVGAGAAWIAERWPKTHCKPHVPSLCFCVQK